MRTFLEVCADIARAKALYDSGDDDGTEQDYAVQQLTTLVDEASDILAEERYQSQMNAYYWRG